MSTPLWCSSRAGISEEVLPPWTPIKTQRCGKVLSLYVWRQRYDFSLFVFPSQIESQDSPLFSFPMRLIIQTKGVKNIAWREFHIEEEKPGYVILYKGAETKDLTIFNCTCVEYDGMIKIDLGTKASLGNRVRRT